MTISLSRFGAMSLTVLLLAACGGPRDRSSTGDAADTARRASPTAASVPASSPAPAPAADSATQPVNAPRMAPVGASKPERSARRVVVNGVDLTGVGYDKGSDSAPVVVVNFSDFGCPFCGSFARETEPSIEREYVRTGKVFFKYVPFVVGMFPNGQQAARAAECAADQGKFWPMHDRLYAAQTRWKQTVDPLAAFRQFAISLGMDTARFGQCYAANRLHPRTQRANDAADQLGVRVTPTFVVNGRGVEGALPLPQFRQLLDAAVKEAK